MRPDLKARTLIVATASLGGALLGVAAIESGSAPLSTLALLAAAVFFTELIVVPDEESSLDPRDTTSFTFSVSVHIAAVLLLGPWASALVAAFGVIAAGGLRRRPLRQVAFNASTFALAAASGGFAFQALGGRPGALDLPGDFPAIVALAVVVFSVGALLVSAVVALDSGMPFVSTMREASCGVVATSVAEAGLGVALAFFALTEPWATVALFPLVLAVYRSHERLVTLRRETAHALETFANVVDERDPYTYRHSARVAEYVRSLARGLGLPAGTVAQLRWAGRLHDLGKIAVDAAVLRKPGRLADDELASLRRHPRLSARLLRRFRLASDQAQAVEYHHERVDGTGYYGIGRGEIPLAAHFLIVADSYDAMTTDRPYRESLPAEIALEEIERNAGAQFHPTVAKAFVALQRGLDPLAVLTSEERAEIRRLAGFRSGRAVRGRFEMRSELIAAGGVIGALVAVGAGVSLLALPALLLALVGLTLRRLDAYRARRLAGRLRQVACEHFARDAIFSRLAGELAQSCDLRWAGLVAWWEREFSGLIELEWSAGALGPSDTSLTSWLVREAESTLGLLVGAGAELGREDLHVAVPLRRDGTLRGYLVLAIGGRLSRPVEEALGATADVMARSLLAPVAADLPARPLKAVAL